MRSPVGAGTRTTNMLNPFVKSGPKNDGRGRKGNEWAYAADSRDNETTDDLGPANI